MVTTIHKSNAALEVGSKIRALRQEVCREFGLVTQIVSGVFGPVLLWSTRREERRLAAGHTYEPRTIIERRNWAPPVSFDGGQGAAAPCLVVES